MYLVKIGLIDYNTCHSLQKRIISLKTRSFSDILLIVEHPPVITVGHRGKSSNILVTEKELNKKNISTFYIERGGDVTYHGPGQLIGYPIINLTDYRLKVRDYIYKLEEVIISTLKECSIKSERNIINPGVWVEKEKIASIGIGIKRWITYHGFALNINTNLEEFNLINPCGLNVGITSMEKIKKEKFDFPDISEKICKNFEKIFNVEFEEITYNRLIERIESFEHTEETSLVKNKAPIR